MPEPTYKYRAAREAFACYGKDYAASIESHTDALVGKGFDVADQTLSEALMGNDSL